MSHPTPEGRSDRAVRQVAGHTPSGVANRPFVILVDAQLSVFRGEARAQGGNLVDGNCDAPCPSISW